MSIFEEDKTDAPVAQRFTFAMNAATSRFGVLCDIPITFVAVAAFGTVAAGVYTLLPHLPVWLVGGFVGLPAVVCAGAHAVLLNSRQGVVAWLRGIPFPIENVNAVLCGSGEYFEVFFRDELPSREEVMSFLERSSDEVFVLEQDEERRGVSARFAVSDSKYNPYGTAYRRYQRLRVVVERALVPLHEAHPIERVLIV